MLLPTFLPVIYLQAFLVGPVVDDVIPRVSWTNFFVSMMLTMVFTPLLFLKGAAKSSEFHFTAILLILVFALTFTTGAPCPANDNYANAFIVGRVDTSKEDLWVADTGYNRFITNNLDDFIPSSITDINLTVGVGNGSYCVKRQGNIVVENHLGQTILCSNALYMPHCQKKLMPANPFIKKGCKLSVYGSQVVMHSPDQSILLVGNEFDGLYYFKVRTVLPKEFATRPVTLPVNSSINSVEPSTFASYFGLPAGHSISSMGTDFAKRLLETHWAYGHLNFDKINTMFGLKKSDAPHCAACAVASSRKTPLNKLTDRSTRVNHRLHVDIGFTSGSRNPFQLSVDDFTRVSHLDLLTSKGDVLTRFSDLKKLLDNQHSPWKLAFVRTDNEFVYTSNDWIDYCKEEGIEHEFSPPHRHYALGVVERCMQTVGVGMRCMMLQGNAPEWCIPYALTHANIIRNHSPSKANGGLTPLEKQAGMKLPINHRLLKGVLFCLVYIHIYEEERIKHGDRSVPCVYLGFDATNNQFIAMEWLTGKIHYCGDGKFVPDIFPFRANPHRVPAWMCEGDQLTPSSMVSEPHPANHSLPTGPRRAYRQHSEVYSGPSGLPSTTTSNELLRPLNDSLRSSARQHEYRHSIDENGTYRR
jgi:hypothetical protein